MPGWEAAAARRLMPLALLALHATGCAAPDSGMTALVREHSPIEVSDGWWLRWGDSPRDGAGTLEWLHDPHPPPAWRPVVELSQRARGNDSNMWLRTRLPDWQGRDPSIFVHSVDINFEVYLGADLIYRFGRLDENGRGRFIGWPWHVIPLPRDFAGKVMSLRIYSDTGDIGIVGAVLLGSRADHYARILRKDQDRVVLGFLYLFVACLAFVFSIRWRERRAAVAFGVFTLQVSIWTIAQAEMKQMFLNAPMFWIYADLTALYLMPAALATFIEETYAVRFRFLMKWVRAASMLYAAGALVLPALGAISLPATIAPFNVLEMIALVLLVITTGDSAMRGDPEARIVTVGVLVLAPFVVYDTLNTWLGWSPPVSHWGVLLFTSSLLLILRRRFLQVHSQSIHDGLTGVANRYRFDALLGTEWRRAQREMKPLSLIMVDIDFFKNFNDTYGHTRGDEVLKGVAGALAAHVRRAPDMVARFGGEEFVVLLPEADEKGAANVAERLRIAVEGLAIPHGSSAVADRVTISLGVAAMVPRKEKTQQDLVEKADMALYRAKQEGRNRTCLPPDSPTGVRMSAGPR